MAPWRAEPSQVRLPGERSGRPGRLPDVRNSTL